MVNQFLVTTKTVISYDLFIIREHGGTLYAGLQHALPHTNTKFKLLLLPTQTGLPYTFSTLYVGCNMRFHPIIQNLSCYFSRLNGYMPYTNTRKHRTLYFKSTLTFLGPSKCWKSNSSDRQKPIIPVFLHRQ